MAYIPNNRRRSPWVRKKVAFENVAQDTRYWSMDWRRAREAHLRQHPLCKHCEELGTLVDHIVAVTDGGEFYNPSNWQTLCRRCHGIKTALETRARRGNGGRENG